MAELKKLLPRQDSTEAAALQGSLHISPYFTHSWRPQNQFLHLGMATGRLGRRGGDHFSPSQWISFPSLPQERQINPSWSLPGSGCSKCLQLLSTNIIKSSAPRPSTAPKGHNFPPRFIFGQFACAFLPLLSTGGERAQCVWKALPPSSDLNRSRIPELASRSAVRRDRTRVNPLKRVRDVFSFGTH